MSQSGTMIPEAVGEIQRRHAEQQTTQSQNRNSDGNGTLGSKVIQGGSRDQAH